MKVLMANKFFFLNGGSETVLFQERESLLSKGVEVVDFSMRSERNKQSAYADYFVDEIDYNTSGAIGKLKAAVSFVHSCEAVDKISRLVRDTKPDIAHLHNIYHQLTPSIIPALKRAGVKVVLTLHDTKLVCPAYLSLCKGNICDRCHGDSFYNAFVGNCQESRSKGMLLMVEGYFHRLRKSYSGVDRIIAPSRFLADKVSADRNDIAKVEVLRNGIDTEKYSVSYSDDGYMLYLGRLSSEKGVKTLIEAHAAMRSRDRLVVVGGGPLHAELEKKYADRVKFTGYQQGKQLKELLANASCVVVPSEWYENCSMVVLEAMAYGKPVVGSRVGGIPEQVEDGVTGSLFEMGNVKELASKLDELMGDAQLRKRLGRAARQRLEDRYSLKAHNDGLMDIYNELYQS